MKSLIVVGASGVGKSTILSALTHRWPVFELVLSYTTRPPRPHQTHAQHYYFVDDNTFEQKKSASAMLETKLVYGNWYGTSRQHYTSILERDKIPLLDVDLEGMLDIKAALAQSPGHSAYAVCILPPSMQVLEQRLRGRGTESEEKVHKRMAESQGQLEKMMGLSMPGVHFVANYQYQLTTFGLQIFLARHFPAFRRVYWRKNSLIGPQSNQYRQNT